MLAATKRLLRQQQNWNNLYRKKEIHTFVATKDKTFVATKMLILAAPASDSFFGFSLKQNEAQSARAESITRTLVYSGKVYISYVFTRMPGESYRRRLRSSLFCLRDVFQAPVNSLVSWSCFCALVQICCFQLLFGSRSILSLWSYPLLGELSVVELNRFELAWSKQTIWLNKKGS